MAQKTVRVALVGTMVLFGCGVVAVFVLLAIDSVLNHRTIAGEWDKSAITNIIFLAILGVYVAAFLILITEPFRPGTWRRWWHGG